MMSVILSLLLTLRTWAHSRAALQLEVLALRHQLQVLQAEAAKVATREGGPLALGPAFAHLDRMANGARDRQARDCHRLAPTRLPAVVDLEKPAPHRATDGAGRHPDPDSHDGASESALGGAADSWRTAETRDRHLLGHRRQIPGSPAPAAVADMAHLPAESHRPDCRGRFLRRPYGDLPAFVRLGAPRPRSATHLAHGGHRSSDGGLDGPTTPRGVPVGRCASISASRS